MNSIERVTRMLRGEKIDRQPVYGWIEHNLKDEVKDYWGSIDVLEDKYEFDMVHIFGGPSVFDKEVLEQIRAEEGEVPPDILLTKDYYLPNDEAALYQNVREQIEHYHARGRFCYVQTPGFFECFNSAFGIENHLMYLITNTEDIATLYRRHVDWVITFADHCIDAGADMIHLSDDWGAQKNMMFSPELWRELIFPNVKRVIDHVHARGKFVSLHSDGCIAPVADGIAELGFDLLHPWQENAGMSHQLYCEKYADQFAIMGGICVQSALGLMDRPELEAEIRRVFKNLRGKRWVCCTSHFVQKHCKVEDIEFAYDLIYKLARE